MKDRSPMVTVLMPAYNAGPYIREAVDSVLAQTYTDFELLIINDGSKDDTANILSTYTDPRIKVLHQDNMGLVKTLNKGLSIAQGTHIARFDADDVCYPHRLQVQVDFMQQHPDHVLVASEADYMDEQGNFIFTYKLKDYEDSAIRASAFKECPFIHSTVMFIKDAVVKAGGYDARAVTFEDHLLWRDLVPYGKMENLRQSLIKVRLNPESATIDEKWRGKEFIELKQRSIENGSVSDADYQLLKDILKSQNFTAYKKAAYHSMLGKKNLWNQHRPELAREHLRTAISIMPRKAEPYALYLLSFLPQGLIEWLYSQMKK
ncbi:glycosyltransferase family 2 protein [Polluticoccus soli]|uniref:glycosyltransferase family 2 protein n=1 Tax=Polluticoccus soli TaxID=3034150 RepID=UPI0023E1EA95|nr:glycosyltransferase [Flavipsychrobacter sp. JY13-12]